MRARGKPPTRTPPRTLPTGVVLTIELVLLVLLWLGFVAFTVRGSYPLAYDSFRDIAYARGILAGHAWEDPMIAGLRAWYPPGLPALFAGASALTGLDVTILYASSAWWLSWTLALVLFLLVRQVWGRTTAWLAVPFVVLGSRWWLVHALMPMSSIQTVPLALAAILVWHRFGRGSWKGAAATALLLAATFWCHVLSGAMAISAIAIHETVAWLAASHAGAHDARHAWRHPGLAAAAIGLVLGAPPLVAQLVMPRLNEAPHHWFAPELHDPRFALHADTPLAPLLGIVGLVTSLRRRGEEGWLAGLVLTAGIGVALGYAGRDFHWPVPWVLPHEFQWFFQLGLMIAAAVGAVRLGERLARGTPARVVAVLLAVVSLGTAAGRLRDASSYMLPLDSALARIFRMGDWIRHDLPPRSTLVAQPEVAYFVCALSGSRTILIPSGHLNPAADLEARTRDLGALFSARDDSTFAVLASRYDADYLLATVDVAPMRELRGRYDTWPRLEEIHAEDSIAVLYHLLSASPAARRERRGAP